MDNRPKVELNVAYRAESKSNPANNNTIVSLAMALDYLGVKGNNAAVALEDELFDHAIGRGLNRQKPTDLAKIVGAYGRKDIFTDAVASLQDAKDWLSSGNPCVIHGNFRGGGHTIVLIGHDEQGFYAHDPYGKYLEQGYEPDSSGAFVYYLDALIKRVCMPAGKSNIHFLSR